MDASSQEKADKIFDRITVNITGDRDKVSGTTNVASMSNNNAQFSIDYYIMMPRSINVNLANSFGASYVEDVDGYAKIRQEYGDVDIQALNGTDNDITVKFGKGSVDDLKVGTISVEYGEMRIDNGGDLDITTRFSDLEVDKMGSLNLDSQYDDINIDNSGPVDVTARFSDVSIDKLKGDFSFDCQYGGLDAGYISAGFTKGKIDAAFTDVSLTFETGASFQVNAEMKFCELKYPESRSTISHKEENYVTNLYDGVIGTDKNTTSSLVIESQNGDVKISY